jgi:hypothetical protein
MHYGSPSRDPGRDKDFIALPLLIALRNQRQSGN